MLLLLTEPPAPVEIVDCRSGVDALRVRAARAQQLGQDVAARGDDFTLAEAPPLFAVRLEVAVIIYAVNVDEPELQC